MDVMDRRMTIANTPGIFGQPASTGMGLGLFQLNPEQEAADYMTGFNIALEKNALALQERIESRMGITGSEDAVVHPSGAMEEPWVPGGVTRASATTPGALPLPPAPAVQTAAIATAGVGGGAMSGAIQGGIAGAIGAMVFAPKKIGAVALITALVGGLIGAASSGTPQQRP
jgi:hypothetical protein